MVFAGFNSSGNGSGHEGENNGGLHFGLVDKDNDSLLVGYYRRPDVGWQRVVLRKVSEQTGRVESKKAGWQSPAYIRERG